MLLGKHDHNFHFADDDYDGMSLAQIQNNKCQYEGLVRDSQYLGNGRCCAFLKKKSALCAPMHSPMF